VLASAQQNAGRGICTLTQDTKDEFLLSMNNHGRGRKPRGRGFDDDFGGGGSDDRGRSGGGFEPPRFPSSFGAPVTGFGPESTATVKWFNGEKGFGFVELTDGSGDVFLHINALSGAGHQTVSPGATLKVRVGQGQKGRQVTEVLSVDNSTATPGGGAGAGGGGGGFGARPPGPRGPAPARRAPDMSSAVEKQGTVKMYNSAKGFGFVALPEGGKDVFVHASALQRSGLTTLSEGQTILMDVVQGAKGPEAVGVREI
jgi:CspA family cold shock protein